MYSRQRITPDAEMADVESLLQLAQKSDIKTVAEWVETKADAEMLTHLGAAVSVPHLRLAGAARHRAQHLTGTAAALQKQAPD